MMSLEFKGTILGLAAALGVLGVTFGLSATMQPRKQTEVKRPQSETRVSLPATAMLAGEANRGGKLFERNCAHCHGDDARGDEGPNLYNLLKSDGRIATIINKGIKGEMPAFGKKFNNADLQALVSYLRTLND